MIGFPFGVEKKPTIMIAGNDCSLREKKNPSIMIAYNDYSKSVPSFFFSKMINHFSGTIL